jgi:hypothetical protein
VFVSNAGFVVDAEGEARFAAEEPVQELPYGTIPDGRGPVPTD